MDGNASHEAQRSDQAQFDAKRSRRTVPLSGLFGADSAILQLRPGAFFLIAGLTCEPENEEINVPRHGPFVHFVRLQMWFSAVRRNILHSSSTRPCLKQFF